MTFLELCQRVREEAGISGTGPVTVVGQSGEMKRIVNWVNSAWGDIQRMRRNWRWMRGSFSFNTTANDYDYTPVQAGILTRFRAWDRLTLRIYLASLGLGNQHYIPWISYNDYLRIYLTGPLVYGTPVCYSIGPDNKLLLGPTPDGIYTVVGDYFKANQDLALDADEPELPDEYHEYIVFRALEKYGFYESAGEVISRAREEQRHYKRTLEGDQLPCMEMSDPLV
jgi:hypothetical protein